MGGTSSNGRGRCRSLRSRAAPTRSRWRTKVVAVLVVTTLGTGGNSASAQEVYVGVCIVTLTTTAPTPLLPVGTLLTPLTIQVQGSGTCEVNGEPGATIVITGSVQTAPLTGLWSCAAGAAVGDLTYTVTGLAAQPAETAIATVGPELSLAAASTTDVFAATAELVETTQSTLACAAGNATSRTWCGVLVFTYANGVIPGTDVSAAA